jgi:hypothetical protein
LLMQQSSQGITRDKKNHIHSIIKPGSYLKHAVRLNLHHAHLQVGLFNSLQH